MIGYYVEAHSSMGEFGCEIEARDLHELAQKVRETFAWMNGCHGTSKGDFSWIDFKYDLVQDLLDDGENDITAEAENCK